jgi:surface protein
MPTIQEQINQLKIDKQNLVNILNNMGVEANDNETFTSLTPKVGTIAGKEDLTNELTTYDSELTIQDNNLASIYEALENKGVIASKYKPKFISFYKYDGTDLTNEIANLDTTDIISMRSMFDYCSSVTSLDLSNFNTSNVTDMFKMFYYCRKLKSLNVSNFKTNNVTNMSQMFYYCDVLTELILNNFNTSNVTDMSNMFYQCKVITELDLSSFDTSNVTNMNQMFSYCGKLAKLDIRNFAFDKVTTYKSIFDYVPADCEIIVKDDTAKEWVLTARSDLTNVKTVAEL